MDDRLAEVIDSFCFDFAVFDHAEMTKNHVYMSKASRKISSCKHLSVPMSGSAYAQYCVSVRAIDIFLLLSVGKKGISPV